MKNLFKNFFLSLPFGAKLLLLIFVCAFPVAWIGAKMHAFNLYEWLGLCPALVLKGQIWRALTWGLLPANVVDWLIGAFWLATLCSLVARNWTSFGFWLYCLIGIFGESLILVIKPGWATATIEPAMASRAIRHPNSRVSSELDVSMVLTAIGYVCLMLLSIVPGRLV